MSLTPKQKAIELVVKYHSISGFLRFSKVYAIIPVN
jgi:hypothetical protein